MPCQYRAADVVLLGAGLAALAFLHPEHLLAFAVVLLDFPACAAHALHGDGGVLGRVIGGYVFRAVGRRNPKQFHLVIHREPLYFHPLAAQQLIVEPCQLGNWLVGVLSAAFIHLAVGLERAIKQLSGPVDVHHQILGGVPGVHQHGAERQLLGFEGVVEHVPHVVELGLAVAAGVVHPPVDDPMLAGVKVGIQAIDHANALHDAVLVAAVLAAHQFHLEGVALVQHGVVEDQAGVCAAADNVAHGRPDGIRGYVVLHEIPVYGVMRENRLVLGHIGLSVVDECRKDELAIVPTCWL